MSKRSMEFAGVMALVILAVANLGVFGQIVIGTGSAIKKLAYGWHELVVGRRTQHEAPPVIEHESIEHDYVVVGDEASILDDNVEVQKAALYAVAEHTFDQSKLAAILESVALDRLHPELAKTAVHLLAELSDAPTAVVTLEKVLTRSVHASVRRAAVYALGELAETGTTDVKASAVSVLARCANSDDGAAVRKAAVHTLADIDDSNADAVLFGLAEKLAVRGAS